MRFAAISMKGLFQQVKLGTEQVDLGPDNRLRRCSRSDENRCQCFPIRPVLDEKTLNTIRDGFGGDRLGNLPKLVDLCTGVDPNTGQ